MKRIPVFALPCLILSLSMPAVAPAADEGLSPDDVILSRGDAQVTVADFRASLLRVPAKMRAEAADNPETVEKLMAQLLENRLLAERARANGLHEDAVIQRAIRQGEEKVLARAEMERVGEEAPEADYEQMAREHYLTHKEDFRRPETLSVGHVLISTQERSEEAAAELAAEVYDKAVSGEASFDELVEEYSEDPGKDQNDGYYRNMPPDRFAEPFAKAALALEPGEISEPVQTQYGYHVILLEKHQESRIRPFEEVKGRIIPKMRERHVRRVQEDYKKNILDQTKPSVNGDVLEALLREADRATEDLD
jgi:peptidyl-prolyl cis-trans isomerase C